MTILQSQLLIDKKKILSNERISQDDIHQIYNGVVPELAARNHVFHIDKITKKALKNADLRLNNIDIIASTAGPGLDRRFISRIIIC